MIGQYPPIRKPSGSARWVIRKSQPRTALCEGCGIKRNRMSVYQGTCYTCLQGASRRDLHVVATTTRTDGCSAACRRLSGHRGDHKPVKSARIAA
jgi:hypothetical protein